MGGGGKNDIYLSCFHLAHVTLPSHLTPFRAQNTTEDEAGARKRKTKTADD